MSGVIDLSMNEGEPPSRECLEVLEDLGPRVFRKYAGAEPLEEAYAAYLGTDAARVLATTGADDAIDRVFRAFLAHDQDAVFPTPTFIMVPLFARHGRRAPATDRVRVGHAAARPDPRRGDREYGRRGGHFARQSDGDGVPDRRAGAPGRRAPCSGSP